MKTRILLFLTFAACMTTQAETQCPDFESLSPDVQKKWGYKVHRVEGSNPSISVEISPSSAPYCKAARLCLKDKNKKLLAEINIAPWTTKDGTMKFTLNIFDDLDGYGELIIYTDRLPDPTIPLTGDGFGGFTFKLSKGFKSK